MKKIVIVVFTLVLIVLVAAVALRKSQFTDSLFNEYRKDLHVANPEPGPDQLASDKSGAGPAEDFLVELKEKADRYIATVHTQGFEISDIDLKIADQQLTIFFKVSNAVNRAENKDEDFEYLSRYMGLFSKTLKLPGPVAAEKITSYFKNDVLTIDLPKK